MQDTELVMKYHGLGPLGVKAMSDPLEVGISSKKGFLEYLYLYSFVSKMLHTFEPRREKTLFYHMRTTKAQISLRIRAI